MDWAQSLTRGTIFVALALYALSVGTLLWAADRRGAQRMARGAWTLGLLAYLAHVAAAFGFYSHWSHTWAYLHTAQRTAALVGLDWGGGLYFNYLFTVLWVADAAWWWLAPESYRRRPVVTGIALHAFFLFMIFQATVVFAAGAARWLGVAILLGLAGLWCARHLEKWLRPREIME